MHDEVIIGWSWCACMNMNNFVVLLMFNDVLMNMVQESEAHVDGDGHVCME